MTGFVDLAETDAGRVALAYAGYQDEVIGAGETDIAVQGVRAAIDDDVGAFDAAHAAEVIEDLALDALQTRSRQSALLVVDLAVLDGEVGRADRGREHRGVVDELVVPFALETLQRLVREVRAVHGAESVAGEWEAVVDALADLYQLVALLARQTRCFVDVGQALADAALGALPGVEEEAGFADRALGGRLLRDLHAVVDLHLLAHALHLHQGRLALVALVVGHGLHAIVIRVEQTRDFVVADEEPLVASLAAEVADVVVVVETVRDEDGGLGDLLPVFLQVRREHADLRAGLKSHIARLALVAPVSLVREGDRLPEEQRRSERDPRVIV